MRTVVCRNPLFHRLHDFSGDLIQRCHHISQAEFSRGLGHAINNATFLILPNDQRSLLFENMQTGSTTTAVTGTKSVAPITALARRQGKSEIVTIGISTGGPNALARMMPMLPGDLGVPIVIVQHMPPVFTKSLANSLNAKCALTVKEAQDGEALQANVAYIAPGGKQMKLVASADGSNRLIKITNDPPENSCRPSADYLFRSVVRPV
jgi:chemotaxis response regulator CheB